MNEDKHAPVDERQAGTAKPIAVESLDPGRNATAGALLAEGAGLLGALKNVKVKLSVCIGSSEVALGELMQARAEQVLVLEQGMEQPVDLLLEGQVVARGVLVAVDDRFGVRITELPSVVERPTTAPKG